MAKKIQVEMEMLNKQYLQALDKSQKATKKSTSEISKDFGKMGKNVLSVGKIVGGVLAGGFALLAAKAIKGAAALEQHEIALTTMLKSATKAKQVLKDFNKFAAETPFESEEVLKAGKQMIAFGFSTEQTMKNLKMIGDVAAGIGAPLGALSEIYAKIKVGQTVYNEDLNQLASRGIPIFDELAKVTGRNAKEIKKMSSEGKIGFKEIEQAFKNMTTAGGTFEGLMKAQSQSLSGLFSTLKSQVDLAATAIGVRMTDSTKIMIRAFSNSMRSGGLLADMFGGLGDLAAASATIITKAFIGMANVINKIRKSSSDAEIKLWSKQRKNFLERAGITKQTSKEERDMLLKKDGSFQRVLMLTKKINAENNHGMDLTARGLDIAESLAEFDAKKVEAKNKINENIKKNNALTTAGMSAGKKELLEIADGTDVVTEATKKLNEQLKKNVEVFTSTANAVSGMAGQINNVIDQFAQNEQTRIDETFNKRKEAIEKSTLSEEEKARRIMELEKEREKQAKRAARDEAIRAKTFGIIEATIATAASVAKALPNFPLAIASGLLGAAQIAAIAAQPIPSLDTGTMDIPSDTLANIHKGEIVVPKSFSDSIRAGEASLGGGGGDIIVQGSIIDAQGLLNAVDAGREQRAFNMGVQNYAETGVYK